MKTMQSGEKVKQADTPNAIATEGCDEDLHIENSDWEEEEENPKTEKKRSYYLVQQPHISPLFRSSTTRAPRGDAKSILSTKFFSTFRIILSVSYLISMIR